MHTGKAQEPQQHSCCAAPKPLQHSTERLAKQHRTSRSAAPKPLQRRAKRHAAQHQTSFNAETNVEQRRTEFPKALNRKSRSAEPKIPQRITRSPSACLHAHSTDDNPPPPRRPIVLKTPRSSSCRPRIPKSIFRIFPILQPHMPFLRAPHSK